MGLLPLRQEETPGDREHATAMYAAWIAHEAELRDKIPARAVDEMIDEARSVGGRLALRGAPWQCFHFRPLQHVQGSLRGRRESCRA